MQNKKFIQLSRPHLPEINEYKKLLDRLWKTRWITNFGFYAKAMEKEASKFLKTENVAVVSSCDLGLLIALQSLKLKKGDEVILSPFTFNSTANSVLWNNLKPVFADIDAETWCLDAKDVQKKITKKTRVVIGTHVFGNPCDVKELRKVIGKRKIVLMFDSAQAYGSVYKGLRVGALGDIEVFSFSGTKTVISAEGGMIVTKIKSLMPLIRLIRNYGFSYNYNTQILGINGKISEFNAALGYLSMKDVKNSLKVRNKIAQYYIKKLKGVGDIKFQKIEKGNLSTYKDFCILTAKRDELSKFLWEKRIETRKYFFPIYKTDYFKKFFKPLKNIESISKQNICIPIFNDISKTQLDYVIAAIKNFYQE